MILENKLGYWIDFKGCGGGDIGLCRIADLVKVGQGRAVDAGDRIGDHCGSDHAGGGDREAVFPCDLCFRLLIRR